MLLSLEGNESSGKTTLAYTAPLPIVGFAYDMGWERALMGYRHQEFFAGLDIQVISYDKGKIEPDPVEADIVIYELPQPIQLGGGKLSGCIALWNYFIVRIAAALTDKRTRSIVVDTMTTARRIKADAHLEEIQGRDASRIQLIQIEYGRPNDAIRDLYTTGAGVRKNLIAVHHLTDERKDSINARGEVTQVLTGNQILEGLGNTYRFVDVAVRMEKVHGKGIKATWRKCGYNLAYEGTSVDNPTWDSLVGQIELGSGDLLKLEHRKEQHAKTIV